MMHDALGLDPWCDWCYAHIDPEAHWETDGGPVDSRFCSAECAAMWGCAATTPRMVTVA